MRFLRAPENLSEVEVDLVELYATVFDGSGHPLRGLQAADFEVDGGRQAAEGRQVRAGGEPAALLGVAIDTSFSMASSLAEAQRRPPASCTNLMTPKDRGFTLGFGGRPYLLDAAGRTTSRR